MKIQFILYTGEYLSLGPEQIAVYEQVRAQYQAKGHEILDLPPHECSGIERLEVGIAFKPGAAIVRAFNRPSQDQAPVSEFVLVPGVDLPILAPEA